MQQRFFLEGKYAKVRPDNGLPRGAERSDAAEWPVAWVQFAEENDIVKFTVDELVEDAPNDEPPAEPKGLYAGGDYFRKKPKPRTKPKTKASKK